jgi:Leucine-rich repeat (LRR) protein
MNLGHNRIVSWDSIPLQLEHLDLSHNNILSVSSAVTKMPSLVSVNLSHNFIASITPLEAAKSLRYVFMRNNKVTGAHKRSTRFGRSPLSGG